jgi:uncharacterized membrane protein YbhN (UPF0104 family)
LYLEANKATLRTMRRALSVVTGWLNAHHVESGPRKLAALIAAAGLLGLSAGVGLSYVAGFGEVATVFTHFDWVWFVVALGAIIVSLLGYYVAYRSTFRAACGQLLEPREMRAVVVAGFSGLLSQTTALDTGALRATGAQARETQVWVGALAGLEQGVLALGGCGAAIALLVSGLPMPLSVSLPWAIAPIPGFALAFWVSARYGDQLRDRGGWRRRVAVFLDGIRLIMSLFKRSFTRDAAVPGMAVYWAAEATVLWLTLAAFGLQMSVAPLIVGFATGMLFSRRTSPMAGSGVLMVVMPISLVWAGAPLATAIVAVFAYRVITLWLPLPLALAMIPTLRTVLQRQPQAVALPA